MWLMKNDLGLYHIIEIECTGAVFENRCRGLLRGLPRRPRTTITASLRLRVATAGLKPFRRF
jgi:hypothetical protein